MCEIGSYGTGNDTVSTNFTLKRKLTRYDAILFLILFTVFVNIVNVINRRVDVGWMILAARRMFYPENPKQP